MLSSVKNRIVPSGRSPHTIKSGLLKGITFDLDLRHQTQVYLGLNEKELFPFFYTLSREVKTALDIGAAEGIYSIYWLASMPVGKVIAFEPDTHLIRQIERNLELNGLQGTGRLEIVRKFVGEKDNDCECRLDSFANIQFPCVIKMDIEGAEAKALRHAGSFLDPSKARWIIEVHGLNLERECLEILTQAGYTPHIVSTAWWRYFLPEQRPLEHNRWIIAG